MQKEIDTTIDARITNLENLLERLFQEVTLIKVEVELVKNEGCWLSKQNADHLHGDFKHE